MNKTKEIWIAGFALFSLFFGAGNLILPPMLGFQSGPDWWLVVLGFVVTAVIIPILAIFAHAKLQGSLYDFGKKVSPLFSTVFCILIYLIAVAIPAPRTASVTHEMAIAPLFGVPPLVTSTVYFALVFLFTINRSQIISLIGKFLTPIIGLILLAIIGVALTSYSELSEGSSFDMPFVNGVLEGYQTFDAIGGVVVGAVIIISLNLRGHTSFSAKRELIRKAGLIAGFGLLFIYGGLIFSGALYGGSFSAEASRTEVLSQLSTLTLGSVGRAVLSVLVALACFTTAVGVITGASDYVRELFGNSKNAYWMAASAFCLIGIIVGSFEVGFIIDVAVPGLMFLYPITIILILLNVISDNYASSFVFRTVVLVTFLFSIPDVLGVLFPEKDFADIKSIIPLANYNLGWVIPAILTFIVSNVLVKKKAKRVE